MIFSGCIQWNGNMGRFFERIGPSMALLAACLWAVVPAGCGKTAVVGLYPEYPPVTRKALSLETEFVAVDTLTPTFRWQPLAVGAASSDGRGTAQIDDITYEIRIWRTVSGRDGKLAYRREHLTACEHRLAAPLDPGRRYYWSVRAHFQIEGHSRTTEWTLAGNMLRNEPVPNDACLRFKTPERPARVPQ